LILVQQHIVKPGNEYFDECLKLTHLSKNLYNQALYRVRQHYFLHDKKVFSETENCVETKSYKTAFDLINEFTKEKQIDYYALPVKVSSMVLRKLDKNFISFFRANQDYKVNPGKYKAKPRIPNYLDKEGSFVTEYYRDAISKRSFKKGFIVPSKTSIKL